MSKKCSIEALQMELFDTLIKLKSQHDPVCDECEKCSIEEADAVVRVADSLCDTFKVEVQALNLLAKTENPKVVKKMIIDSGLCSICEKDHNIL